PVLTLLVFLEASWPAPSAFTKKSDAMPRTLLVHRISSWLAGGGLACVTGSTGAVNGPAGAPHEVQKRSAGVSSCPQEVQNGMEKTWPVGIKKRSGLERIIPWVMPVRSGYRHLR